MALSQWLMYNDYGRYPSYRIKLILRLFFLANKFVKHAIKLSTSLDSLRCMLNFESSFNLLVLIVTLLWRFICLRVEKLRSAVADDIDKIPYICNKDSEIQRKNFVQPMEISKIEISPPLPVETEKFWPFNKNKLHLQLLLHKEMTRTAL